MAPNRTRVPEFHEGPEAGRRFTEGVKRVLRVSKDELVKREAADRTARKKARAVRTTR